MTTLATNTPARNKYATVHARLRTLGVNNESEQRNLYAGVTGKRSLRDMTNGERKNLELWLLRQINAAPVATPKPANEDAQSWLD